PQPNQESPSDQKASAVSARGRSSVILWSRGRPVSIEPIEKLADTSGRQRHTRIGGTIVLRLHEDVCVRPFSRERVRQVRRECGDAAVARQVIAKDGES